MFRAVVVGGLTAAVLALAGAAGAAGDGAVIVFPGAAEGTNVTQLFSIEPSGGNLRQLTSGKYAALYPAFSPTGARIAFARFGVGSSR